MAPSWGRQASGYEPHGLLVKSDEPSLEPQEHYSLHGPCGLLSGLSATMVHLMMIEG